MTTNLPQTLTQKALRGLAWSLADKFVNQLGYLAVTVYLARLIGPESFGFIAMLTIFILIAESVVSGGFTQALVQRSQHLTEEDCSTIFYVNLGWGICMYAALFVAAPWIAEFYRQEELTEISRVLFIVVIINSLAVVARARLTIAVDFKSQAMAGALATTFSAILAIVLAQAGQGYWALVWLILLRSIFQTLGIWLFCQWVPSLIFSRKSFKSLFGFGSNLMAAGIIAVVSNNLYVALAGRFFGAAQAGYFVQATNLSNYVTQFIGSSLQGVAFPILTSVKEDRERLIGIYTQVISATMLISLPILVGFASVSREFVLIFLGQEWLPVVPVLAALCLARTVTPISAINMNILNAVGRSDLFLKVDLLKLPLTLVAMFLALPYGIEGLAWTMVITSFIAFFINAYLPGVMFGFGALRQIKIGAKYVISAAFMYVIVIHLNIVENIMVLLLLKVTAGCCVYFSLVIAMRDRLALRYARVAASKLKHWVSKWGKVI